MVTILYCCTFQTNMVNVEKQISWGWPKWTEYFFVKFFFFFNSWRAFRFTTQAKKGEAWRFDVSKNQCKCCGQTNLHKLPPYFASDDLAWDGHASEGHSNSWIWGLRPNMDAWESALQPCCYIDQNACIKLFLFGLM